MEDRLSDKKVLVIGQVWPESKSSAAGKRMLQLLECFYQWGMKVYFTSTANKSPYSDDLSPYDVQELEIWLNDKRTDEVLLSLNPDIVIYDRFMVEEQFGWRVTECCPNAMTILDTEDLHFLRYARHEMFKKGEENIDHFLYSERSKREIASIMRCDLTLLISVYEYELLVNKFKIDSSLLFYLPFLEKALNDDDINQWKSFDDREGFVFIGNFIHEPNWQTVLYLKTVIWPVLSKKLPKVNMHIYGAYPSQKVLQLHNKQERFLVHGRADDALEVISDARVMLAPIPFGAGIKGKFVDAMSVGTPSITSTVGAESMKGECEWCGFVTDEVEDIVNKAVLLYSEEKMWKEMQGKGVAIHEKMFDYKAFERNYKVAILSILESLEQHRKHNFIGEVFKQNCAQSSKYMGLWIEEKNKAQ